MARSLSVPLLLLGALAVSLVVSPAAGARQAPRRLGGVEDVDVNEEGVQRAVGFAISEYNKGSNDAYHSRAMQVVRARRQVRAGRPGLGRAGTASGPPCASAAGPKVQGAARGERACARRAPSRRVPGRPLSDPARPDLESCLASKAGAWRLNLRPRARHREAPRSQGLALSCPAW